jgi:hypothetical protein
MNLTEILDSYIKEKVDIILSNKELPDTNYIETDNIGEVLEKLVIIHIRMWMLEDAVQEAKTDEEIAEIKRKIDICFKQKRPRFVQAINIMLDSAIETGRSLREDSVKLYKGFKE